MHTFNLLSTFGWSDKTLNHSRYILSLIDIVSFLVKERQKIQAFLPIWMKNQNVDVNIMKEDAALSAHAVRKYLRVDCAMMKK